MNRITAILKNVERELRSLVDTRDMYVVLYDEGRKLWGRYSFSEDSLAVHQDACLPSITYLPSLDDGLAGYVIQRCEPLFIVGDLEEKIQDLGLQISSKMEVKCWLGAPMVVGGQVGVIALQNLERERAFDRHDLGVLVNVANQTAMALRNARLFQELERRNEELERKNKQLAVLPAIYEEIMAVRIEDVDRILDLLYEKAAQIMDLSNAQVQIAFYNEEEYEVTFPLAVEQDDGKVIDRVRWGEREIKYLEDADENRSVKQFQPRTRREPPGLTEYVIRTKEPLLIVENFKEEAASLEITVWPTFGRLDRPTHSWLGVPMIVNDKVIGIISIQSLEQERAFNKEQQNLLQAIANQAAIALEDAKLYQELSKKVDELEQAQKRIAEAENVATRMSIAADVVHRWNNLAGTIPIWVYQAREQVKRDSPESVAIDYLDQIDSNAEEILRATEQININPTSHDIDVTSLLRSLTRQALVQTPANIRIFYEPPAVLPKVHGVESELTNALWNIIENGIDAMPDGGTLKVKTETASLEKTEWIRIEISDTGIGIEREDYDKVFQPFGTTKPNHMGYGLWRAKNIIEGMRGTVDFESEQGKGTTFVVRLPALDKRKENG